jgi:hypothetical protein
MYTHYREGCKWLFRTGQTLQICRKAQRNDQHTLRGIIVVYTPEIVSRCIAAGNDSYDVLRHQKEASPK